MTEIQTGHSSLSANNDAEMLQKELLSYAIKADVFIMCLFLLLWATLLDPVLLFSSLLGNCLQEPCEETLSIPGPARVGQMWACHLVHGSRHLPMGSVSEQEPADAFPRLQHCRQASS